MIEAIVSGARKLGESTGIYHPSHRLRKSLIFGASAAILGSTAVVARSRFKSDS